MRPTYASRWAVLAVALLASAARADEVPLSLQVQLLSKMATYMNFGLADGAALKILVVYPGSSKTPSQGAETIVNQITQVGEFGHLKPEAKAVPFGDVKKFLAVLASDQPQIVYLAPEVDDSTAAGVVEAVTTSPTVTITSVGDRVKRGVILGFSLVEAHPRVLLNLKQAQKQNVIFHSGLTRHAVVVDSAS